MRTVLSVLVCVGIACGQEGWTPHATSTPNPDAQFEIVQSEIAAKFTFKLDRCTGRSWQLVLITHSTAPSEPHWQELRVKGGLPDTTGDILRFQIFTSGLAGRHTFLIDNMTGRSWVFVEDSSKNTTWQKMDDLK